MIQFIDLTVIILYIALVLFVTFKTTKRTVQDYLIARRKLGVFSALATINASKTGSIVLLYVSLLYLYGASAMWYFIGVAVGYLLFIPFAKKIHGKYANVHYSLADYFYQKYGEVAGRLASLLTIFTMFAWLVLNLIASAKVLSFFTGLSFVTSAILIGIVVYFYLFYGGFKAVVTTDMLQYSLIVIILLVFTFLFSGQTDIPSSEWNIGGTGIVNIVAFFLLGVFLTFSAPDLWQRVYACRDAKSVTRGIFYSVLVYIIVGFLLTIIGLAIKTILPGADPDTALISGFASLLPQGILGLGIVVLFAAFMSSIDTYTYTACATFAQNVLKKKGSEAVKTIRQLIAVFLLIAILIAIAIQDLIVGSFIFAGYAVLLAVPILFSWKYNMHSFTVSFCLIFGITFLSLFVLYGLLTNELEPSIVLIALVLSLFGLGLGKIVRFFARNNL